jgi:hypothetical protein
MECPFCAENIKDEVIACKHCSRDLRVVRPLVLEIQEMVIELDGLRRELDHVSAKLFRVQNPTRYFLIHALAYILIPAVLLVIAHVVVTILLNVSPLYLRIASVIIPLPFGLAIYAIQKVGFRGAMVVGVITSFVSVMGMLTVTGINDQVPILPDNWNDWREVMEYGSSIALAFGTGNILGLLIFQILPSTMAQGGKPNPAAFRMARMMGQHVGEEQLRRRARIIQDLMRTAGPLTGVAATAAGSIYAGLKGIMGS